jgi:hypothetical protein
VFIKFIGLRKVMPNRTRLLASVMIGVMLVVAASCRTEKRERVLFDFESDSELDQFHWKCHTLFSLSGEHATHGRQSLKMELFPDDYPGIAPMISGTDWRGFRALEFDVYNTERSEVPLTVRIDDRKDYPDYEDRYNKTFSLAPGHNAISIPFDGLVASGTGHPLNLKNIYRVLMFVVKPQHKVTLHFDYLRLR